MSIIDKFLVLRGLRYYWRKHQEQRFDRQWQTSDAPFIKQHRQRLSALKNCHQGQAAFIIGNGPSINKMDLNLLHDKITIACNAFFLKSPELNFTPTYYTVEDNLPAEDNADTLNALRDTQLLIPYDLRKFVHSDQVTYLNFKRSYCQKFSKSFPYFSHDVLREIFWGGTVLYMNIQLANYLGCNPIYLIGVDLSYKIPDKIKQGGTVLTSVDDDPNHFHPDYFGQGKRWHLPETARMQQAFSKAYHELQSKGVELLNATVGGNLQDIPRVDYQLLFDKENSNV